MFMSWTKNVHVYAILKPAWYLHSKFYSLIFMHLLKTNFICTQVVKWCLVFSFNVLLQFVSMDFISNPLSQGLKFPSTVLANKRSGFVCCSEKSIIYQA